MHYDDLHFRKWKDKNNKAPPRRGSHKVFNRIARAHNMKLFQKLELPATVRDMLQKPQSEENIDKLEELRKAVVSCFVGEVHLQVDCEEAILLARAIERCPVGRFGEVGKGSDILPLGARVVADVRNKTELLELVRALNGDWLKIEMRPFGTCRAPLVSPFYKKMEKQSASELSEELGGHTKLLDMLLLTLHDALWLAKSDEWTRPEWQNYFIFKIN